MNMNTSMNTIFFLYLWEMNKYFSFCLNEYICEYDYEYFRFRIRSHSALLLARAWNYFNFWYL